MIFPDLARLALLESVHGRGACVGDRIRNTSSSSVVRPVGGSGDQRENAFKSRRQPSDVFGVAVFGEAIFLFRPGAGAACPQVNAQNAAPQKSAAMKRLAAKSSERRKLLRSQSKSVEVSRRQSKAVEGSRRQFTHSWKKKNSPFVRRGLGGFFV